LTRVKYALGTFFSPVVLGKENFVVFNEILESETLRKDVVSHLKRIGPTTPTNYWLKDAQLIKLFMELYKSGVVPLPSDPVYRIRWIAIICLECCNDEGFDCGEIILPMDFLPDYLCAIFEEVFGKEIYGQATGLRDSLKKSGWISVFGDI